MRVLFLLLALPAVVAPAASAQDRLAGQALVEALREGGYNIYFRHAATDWSLTDRVAAAGDWESCDPARMRQLSAEGRRVAGAIGEAFRRLDIPVGRVVASEYCRARQTAQHMHLGAVTPTRAVMNLRAAAFLGGREAVVARARVALGTPPPEGTNTVYVAHGNLMRAATGAYTGEAGAVVLAPEGDGRFRLVAQLDPEDWERLARRHAPSR